jgi:hypothetical protein
MVLKEQRIVHKELKVRRTVLYLLNTKTESSEVLLLERNKKVL